MTKTKEELARIHLETAIALVGSDIVQHWLAVDPPTENPSADPSGGKKPRGRKPGAAPEESRCTWKLITGEQCKNTRLEGKSHCKIHSGKADAISAAAASATSSGSSPSE